MTDGIGLDTGGSVRLMRRSRLPDQRTQRRGGLVRLERLALDPRLSTLRASGLQLPSRGGRSVRAGRSQLEGRAEALGHRSGRCVVPCEQVLGHEGKWESHFLSREGAGGRVERERGSSRGKRRKVR
eukprot:scaffold2621_cov31-Tisochrysis_lutea.AAC.1